MSVLVTVGTTSFDLLIQTMCSEECLSILAASGYNEIVLQIGSGCYIPPEDSRMNIQWFCYKESLHDDLRKASLIIGHAGAGTILESLTVNKPLIVVLNEELMNNHQGELSTKLASEGYLIKTICSSLVDSLQSYVAGKFSFRTYKPVKQDFADILHHILAVK